MGATRLTIQIVHRKYVDRETHSVPKFRLSEQFEY